MKMENESPEKISNPNPNLSPDHVVSIVPEEIEQQLKTQYEIFRQKKMEQSFSSKLHRLINPLIGNTIHFLHEFWREIVPEIIRGRMQQFPAASPLQQGEKEALLFQEYCKKRSAFFLIIFRSDCSEQQIQQAYLNATHILPEGLSIKYEEITQTTNFEHWNIPHSNSLEKYSIHFLKFDLFGKLLWFATLSMSQLESNDESYPDHFKREVKAALKFYEGIEMSFLGSYVEKEDRFLLDPSEEK